MDEDLRAPIRVTRWLAWAVAGLLAAGVVSVGVVNTREDGSDRRVVTAAGETASGVDVSTTVTTFVPPPELPVIPPPDPSCGSGDADGYFPTPGSYRMTVVAGPSPVCQGGVLGPSVQTTHL